jgi:autotransporter-associated beta strand protein
MQKTPLTLCNHLFTAVLAAVYLSLSSSLHAQTWDGGGTDASWRTAGNWVGDTLPTYGSTANITFPSSADLNSGINTFLGAGAATQIQNLNFGADVDSALGITLSTAVDNLADARLTFQNTTLNTITVDAGASGNITIGNPINDTTSLPASPASTVQTLGNIGIVHNGTGILTINRPISSTNAVSITKTGTGTWQQLGTVLVTGALNVNEGMLIDSSYINSGSFSAVSAINLGGGTIQYNHPGGLANNRTVTNAINVTANSTIAYINQDPNSKQLALTTGTTTISPGATLTFKTILTNTTLGSLINNDRPFAGSGTVVVEGFNDVNFSSTNFAMGRVAFGGNLRSFEGDLVVRKGTAELYKTVVSNNLVTGRLIIGETGNSFGAAVLIDVASSSSNGNITNNISVLPGGFRSIRGTGWKDYNITLGGGIEMLGDLNVDASMGSTGRSLSLNGPLSGNGHLTVSRAGTTNTVVALGGNNSAWNGDLIVASGNGRFGGAGINVPGNGSIYLGVTGNTNAAILSSYYAAPTIVLNSTNTVTNNITVRSGGSRSLQFAGDARYNFTGNIVLEETLNVNSGLNFWNDKWIILAGNISGNGGLDVTRSGLGGFIELSGNNTYNGNTTISNSATLRANSATGNAIGDRSAVTIVGAVVPWSSTNSTTGVISTNTFISTLDVVRSETVGSLASSGDGTRVLLNANAVLTTGGDNTSTTYAGDIFGSGGITKVGTGMMTLSGTNSTYTGSTTINDGTLALANPLVLRNSPLVTTGGGMVALDVGINSPTFGGLSGTSGNLATIISNYGSVTNLTLNPAAGSVLTYGGVIADGAAGMTLTKTGAGTQILSGANTYTGTTTVSEGTLVASNSNLTANIQPDSTQVIFTTQPSVGTYNILPGPLNTASLVSFNVSGTGGLTANLTNSPNLQVIVTSTSAGPTFATTYPEGSENTIGQNGLKNLMSYALGGTGPSSTPALPVLTVNGSVLTLTATGRNDDPSLRFYGQWTTDLSGATDSFENNSVELTPPNLSFSQSVETGKPRKFMRLKVTK